MLLWILSFILLPPFGQAEMCVTPAQVELSLAGVESPVYEPLLVIIEDYLNAGGDDVNGALQNADEESAYDSLIKVSEIDVTGDGSAELVVEAVIVGGEREDSFIEGGVYAFQCEDERYHGYPVAQIGGFRGGGFTGEETGVQMIEDFNGNGLPEFLLASIANIGIGANYDREYGIYEWDEDGEKFVSLIPTFVHEFSGYTYSQALAYIGSHALHDENGDGTLELVLTSPAYRHHDLMQWSRLNRGREVIWQWNETTHQYENVCERAATPPQYRIQAIEDGADLIRCGDFEKAVEAFRLTIEEDDLETWTAANNLCPGCDPDQLGVQEETVLEMGTPVPDPMERERLSEFARFQLVLLYTMLEDEEAAQREYDVLQNEGFIRLADEFIKDPDCAGVNELALAEAIYSPKDWYVYTEDVYDVEMTHEPVCYFMPDAE